MQVKNVFTGFQFVPKPKKKPQVTKCTNMAYCVCVKRDDGYYARINTSKGEKEIDFTPKSHNLKDRLIVFTKKLDKNKKPICVHRNEVTARYSPGISSQYTPFNNNYIYSGYVVKRNGIYYFDMKECIGAYSSYSSLVSEKIKLNEDK